MASCVITLRQNVEQKRFHIVIEGFMVQKKFSQQTEVLTIGLKEYQNNNTFWFE